MPFWLPPGPLWYTSPVLLDLENRARMRPSTIRGRGTGTTLVSGATIAAVLMIVLAVSARFVHLDADTPEIPAAGIGTYVDEGYKTFAAKNMALWGSPHWNPRDDYPAWLHHSPITQWAYYLGFHYFGVGIDSARAVTVIFFALFLTAYVFANQRRYPPWLLIGGLE